MKLTMLSTGSSLVTERYNPSEDKNIASRKLIYAEEGARHYFGKLWIPDDLKSIEL